MKTLIIIIIVLLLIITFDVLIDRFFMTQLEFYEEGINNIILSIDNKNYENSENDISILISTWEDNIFKWNILCDHADIESIELLFHAANEDINNENYDTVKKTLIQLLHALDNLSNSYKVSWENLF